MAAWWWSLRRCGWSGPASCRHPTRTIRKTAAHVRLDGYRRSAAWRTRRPVSVDTVGSMNGVRHRRRLRSFLFLTCRSTCRRSRLDRSGVVLRGRWWVVASAAGAGLSVLLGAVLLRLDRRWRSYYASQRASPGRQVRRGTRAIRRRTPVVHDAHARAARRGNRSHRRSAHHARPARGGHRRSPQRPPSGRNPIPWQGDRVTWSTCSVRYQSGPALARRVRSADRRRSRRVGRAVATSPVSRASDEVVEQSA